jgi:hypothetical protein
MGIKTKENRNKTGAREPQRPPRRAAKTQERGKMHEKQTQREREDILRATERVSANN